MSRHLVLLFFGTILTGCVSHTPAGPPTATISIQSPIPLPTANPSPTHLPSPTPTSTAAPTPTGGGNGHVLIEGRTEYALWDVDSLSLVRLLTLDTLIVNTNTEYEYMGFFPSPRGDRALVSARRFTPPMTDMFLADFVSGSFAPLVGAAPARSMAWSPDGSMLAFFTEKGIRPDAIYIVKADGTDLHKAADVQGYPNVLWWSPDSASVMWEHVGTLRAVAADGSSNARVEMPGIQPPPPDQFVPFDCVDYSEDGSTIAFVIRFDPTNYHIYIASSDFSATYAHADFSPNPYRFCASLELGPTAREAIISFSGYCGQGSCTSGATFFFNANSQEPSVRLIGEVPISPGQSPATVLCGWSPDASYVFLKLYGGDARLILGRSITADPAASLIPYSHLGISSFACPVWLPEDESAHLRPVAVTGTTPRSDLTRFLQQTSITTTSDVYFDDTRPFAINSPFSVTLNIQGSVAYNGIGLTEFTHGPDGHRQTLWVSPQDQGLELTLDKKPGAQAVTLSLPAQLTLGTTITLRFPDASASAVDILDKSGQVVAHYDFREYPDFAGGLLPSHILYIWVYVPPNGNLRINELSIRPE